MEYEDLQVSTTKTIILNKQKRKIFDISGTTSTKPSVWDYHHTFVIGIPKLLSCCCFKIKRYSNIEQLHLQKCVSVFLFSIINVCIFLQQSVNGVWIMDLSRIWFFCFTKSFLSLADSLLFALLTVVLLATFFLRLLMFTTTHCLGEYSQISSVYFRLGLTSITLSKVHVVERTRICIRKQKGITIFTTKFALPSNPSIENFDHDESSDSFFT